MSSPGRIIIMAGQSKTFISTTKGQLGCEQFFEHFELRDKTGQQHPQQLQIFIL
jgi:hypothetical protein